MSIGRHRRDAREWGERHGKTRREIAAFAEGLRFARHEAMGELLAVIDAAEHMEPAEGCTARIALDQYAEMLRKMGTQFHGEEWADFVGHVRDEQAAGRVKPF